MQVNRTTRAKQFLPFDALKSFQEALREKEIEYEEKRELSEETLSELDDILNRLEIGDNVIIKYYKNRQYIEFKGTITKIDFIKKKIQINKENNINIADIVNILILWYKNL